MAWKVGEEAVEMVIEATNGTDKEYHNMKAPIYCITLIVLLPPNTVFSKIWHELMEGIQSIMDEAPITYLM